MATTLTPRLSRQQAGELLSWFVELVDALANGRQHLAADAAEQLSLRGCRIELSDLPNESREVIDAS